MSTWAAIIASAVGGGTVVSSVEDAATATELANNAPVLAAGMLLVSLGLGLVIASGITYWYERRRLRERLR